MGKSEKEVIESDEILTPVLSDTDIEQKETDTSDTSDTSKESGKSNVSEVAENNYISGCTDFFNCFQERNNNMINSIDNTIQTVQPTANVLFNGHNVKTNSCANGCSGWLFHNENSGIFTLTKPGVYKVHFNACVTNTVAVAPITLNITNAGESISGGLMVTTPAALGGFENVSAEVLVRVPCNSSVVITIKNNTPTNPIQVSQPSLVLTRES
jgi:hypothetical protein